MNTSPRTISRFRLLALLSLAAAGVNSQGVVQAADWSHEVQRSVKVSFADLNLANRQGAVTLYTRIRNAARSVCGPVDLALPADREGWKKCVNDAIASAVAKVGDANLMDYHLAQTKRSHTSVAHR